MSAGKIIAKIGAKAPTILSLLQDNPIIMGIPLIVAAGYALSEYLNDEKKKKEEE